MASLPNPKTVTYEEWLRMPETKCEEVVNGEIRIMPAPKLMHARVARKLGIVIGRQVDEREVIIVDSAVDFIIRLQPLTVRQPDLAVLHAASLVERDGRVHSAPQLIAEVLSASNTRREIAARLADFAGLGVPEVWILSYDARTVEVLYLENGQFVRHAILAEGILKPKLFPDVQIDIAEIWPD